MRSDEFVYCSRCGEEMSRKARYCMKCGNLNYEHPDNKKMEKFADKNPKGIYQIGEGKTIKTNTIKDGFSVPTNTGNPKKFFLYNVLGYCGSLVLIGLILFIVNGFSFTNFLDSSYSFICLIFSVVFLYVCALELMFMKTNNPWWAALIPFYNLGIISKIAMKKEVFAVIYILPIVGFFILLYNLTNKVSIYMYILPILGLLVIFHTMYKIGKQFGYNGYLSALLFPIFIPIIGFRTNSFNKITYLDVNEKNAVEKDFKRRNRLLMLIIVFIFIGVSLYAITNYKELKEKSENVLQDRYLGIAEKILIKVKKNVHDNNITCDKDFKTGYTYYFDYQTAYYELGITNVDSLLGKELAAFVVLKNYNGKETYSISMSDGEYGFAETLEADLNRESIVKYEAVSNISDKNYIRCYINNKD